MKEKIILKEFNVVREPQFKIVKKKQKRKMPKNAVWKEAK